ncbi:efflux RND transporter permease subunit [Brucella abortus]|nr:efflux RND transporter permease subunit [Brucella abortus]
MLGSTYYLFERVPGSLLPDEDQGFLFGVAVLPSAASLERTTVVLDQVSENIRKNPAVDNVFAVSGFDLLSGGLKTSAGTMFHQCSRTGRSAPRPTRMRATCHAPSWA